MFSNELFLSFIFPKDGEVCECNIQKLKDRKNLLQKYLDANTDLEVQALYAVQALFLRLDRPPGELFCTCFEH